MYVRRYQPSPPTHELGKRAAQVLLLDLDGQSPSDIQIEPSRLIVREFLGRARLRKYVVTEQQTVTVPVSHEELRVEREAITDANIGDAVDGPAISEEEHEVVLHAERPVVATEAVPVERVRLGTETVTEQQEVAGEVRKEQIEIDDPTTSSTSTTDQRDQQR